MQDILTWGAVVAAGGSLIAIITFWMNRGKAEAEACAKAEAAAATANTALAAAERVSAGLGGRGVESPRDYATQRDLAAAEVRYTSTVEGLRAEMRGMNDRLDRIME